VSDVSFYSIAIFYLQDVQLMWNVCVCLAVC